MKLKLTMMPITSRFCFRTEPCSVSISIPVTLYSLNCLISKLETGKVSNDGRESAAVSLWSNGRNVVTRLHHKPASSGRVFSSGLACGRRGGDDEGCATRAEYSRTKHLLLSARGARWKEVYVVGFTAFIDDSGTAPSQRVASATANCDSRCKD